MLYTRAALDLLCTRSTRPSASADFNDPDTIRVAAGLPARGRRRSATRSTGSTPTTKHIAYFNSGNNPVRRRRARPASCRWRRPSEWRGFDPDLNTARYTPFAQHPQVVDQPVLTSWNNKQAPGYAGADSNLFSSVFRSQMLDRQLALRLKGGHKLTLPELVDAMEQAGTTDLRGMTSLPLALRVLGTPKDPRSRAAVAKLEAWSAARRAPHRPQPRRHLRRRRRDPDHGRLVAAAHPAPCSSRSWARRLLDQLEATYQIDNDAQQPRRPPRLGLPGGLLRLRAQGPQARAASARSSSSTPPPSAGAAGWPRAARPWQSSLKSALGEQATDTYPADDVCKAGDQACLDAVRFRPLGGVTQPLIPWINRPTYQQAVEVQGTAPR